MAEKTLIARVRPDDAEPHLHRVSSPAVGTADGVPRTGVILNAFDPVVRLRILGRWFTVRLPRDVQGRVVDVRLPDARTPVAFDQVLLRLDARLMLAAGDGGLASVGGESGAVPGAAGTMVIAAPSEGIFYRRPTPEAPPFVAPGSRIATGAVLGLVEVMKCFNQVTYGGPGLPERVEVVEILVADSGEVHFGQPLFRVKPLD